jgi:hypothetical protein
MPAIPAIIANSGRQTAPPNKAIGARVAELRSALRRIWIAEAAAGLELLPQPAVTVSTGLRCALKS